MTSFLLICGREWSETRPLAHRASFGHAPGFVQTWRGVGGRRGRVRGASLAVAVVCSLVVRGGSGSEGNEEAGEGCGMGDGGEREGHRNGEQWL